MNLTDLLEDLRLAVQSLDQSLRRIRGDSSGAFSRKEAKQIESMLTACFWKALPYFVEGSSRNPIHHNTQVLDNMVQIALGQKLKYREFKISVLLALLHDIGNAVSQREKVKTDQVEREANQGKARQLAFKAISFRLEHMDRAPELIAELTNSLIERDALGGDDVHLICRAVLVHDYPSIEEILRALSLPERH
ncbi:MAG: hypothetical protein NTZ09_22135 [Candidatus Hydrogenedentes bacterium]|nr:hypothetical protein [Candidatus Hydrogenedentota bacterium]